MHTGAIVLQLCDPGGIAVVFASTNLEHGHPGVGVGVYVHATAYYLHGRVRSVVRAMIAVRPFD